MIIDLHSNDKAELAQAEELLESLLEKIEFKKDVDDMGKLSYEIKLDAKKGERILEQLLKFPTLRIYGKLYYDLPDRDSSWWGSTTYKSVMNPDGTRRLEVSNSTGWA